MIRSIRATCALSLVFGIFLGTLDACPESLSPPPATPEEVARGAQAFARECAACHGAEGRGDGPALHRDGRGR